MDIKLYDTVLTKDGKEAVIVEILDDDTFIADVGDNPQNWETIDIKLKDIEKIIARNDEH
jgi:ribosomal protein L14E/L6E/L27E